MAIPQVNTPQEQLLLWENNYFIKSSYTARAKAQYYVNSVTDRVYQPDVYFLAEYLANMYNCEFVVDIGCGQGGKLKVFHPRFKIVGIDFGINLAECKSRYPYGIWVEFDLDMPVWIEGLEKILGRSLLICSDVIEHLTNPEYLLANLEKFMKIAPLCIMSTPERDLTRGFFDDGPPDNPAHVREWNSSEFKKMMGHFDLNMKFLGLTVSEDISRRQETILGIIVNEGGQAKDMSLEDLNKFTGLGTTLHLG